MAPWHAVRKGDPAARMRQFTDRAEAFEQRGKAAVATIFEGFAKYLDVPQGVCWVGPPGVAIDEERRWPLHHFAQLRPDGYFAGSMVVQDRDKQPLGFVVRFTFYVRLHEEGLYTLAYGDNEPLRPMQTNSLAASEIGRAHV